MANVTWSAQVEQLVPICVGPVYQTAWKATVHPALGAYRATVLPGRPAMGIPAFPADAEASGHAGDDHASPTAAARGVLPRMVPADAVPDLAKLLVGSTRGIMHIIQDFRVKYPDVAKRQVEIKINEIAVKERRGGANAVRLEKPSKDKARAHRNGARPFASTLNHLTPRTRAYSTRAEPAPNQLAPRTRPLLRQPALALALALAVAIACAPPASAPNRLALPATRYSLPFPEDDVVSARRPGGSP